MHTISWCEEDPRLGRADGFVGEEWLFIIRDNNTSVWDSKIQRWVHYIQHESYEAAKQWCEMYEVTGARQNYSV